jgi:Domain of unknown function (DUF4214)/Domain of unknown function (DUF5666)
MPQLSQLLPGDVRRTTRQSQYPGACVLFALICLFFSPASSAAANPEDARAVARLYSAAFDREPLPQGLNFWIDSLEQGKSLQQIASRFRRSPEFSKKYGALDDGAFVRQLFRNILGREGAEGGIAFWQSKLEAGNSQALVLRQFSESPENRRKTDDLFAEMHRRDDGKWSYAPYSGEVKSTGTIDGFGSVFVNGIEFETDEAEITLDGKPSSEDALRLGMVVTVEGTVNDDGETGTARRVIFDDELQGPVTAIEEGADGDSLLLTILELKVIVERTGTVFDDVTFDSLAVGDVLEVSGFLDEENRLRATRVEGKSGDDALEVEFKGIVTGLAGTEFMLGAYVVDFSGANLAEVPGGTLAEGMFVEVHGSIADGVIIADRIEEEDEIAGRFDDDDEVRVHGTVTNFVSISMFEVNGVTVDGSGALLRPSDLVVANGAVVQVEGDWVAETLLARKIEARRGRVEIEASVESIDAEAGTLTLQLAGGTITIVVDDRTMIDDDTDEDDKLTMDDIAVADFLEVEAIQNGKALVATHIDRDDVDDDVLQATVSAFVPGESITLLGITYSINGTEFESRAGRTLSAEEFFNALQVGDLVKVKDKIPADGIADEAEFERKRGLDGDECESDDDCDSDDDDCDSGNDDCDSDDDDSDDEEDDSDEDDSDEDEAEDEEEEEEESDDD